MTNLRKWVVVKWWNWTPIEIFFFTSSILFRVITFWIHARLHRLLFIAVLPSFHNDELGVILVCMFGRWFVIHGIWDLEYRSCHCFFTWLQLCAWNTALRSQDYIQEHCDLWVSSVHWVFRERHTHTQRKREGEREWERENLCCFVCDLRYRLIGDSCCRHPPHVFISSDHIRALMGDH